MTGPDAAAPAAAGAAAPRDGAVAASAATAAARSGTGATASAAPTAGAIGTGAASGTAGTAAGDAAAGQPAGVVVIVVRAVADAVAEDDGRIVVIGVFAVRALAVDEILRRGIPGIPAAGRFVLGQRAVGQVLRRGVVRHGGHTGLPQKLHLHGAAARHGVDIRHVHGNLVIADEGLFPAGAGHDVRIEGALILRRDRPRRAGLVEVIATAEGEVGRHFHQYVVILRGVQIVKVHGQFKRGRGIRHIPERERFRARRGRTDDFRLIGHGVHPDDQIIAKEFFLAAQRAVRAVLIGHQLVAEAEVVILMRGVRFAVGVVVRLVGGNEDQRVGHIRRGGGRRAIGFDAVAGKRRVRRRGGGLVPVGLPDRFRQEIEIAVALVARELGNADLPGMLRNLKLHARAVVAARRRVGGRQLRRGRIGIDGIPQGGFPAQPVGGIALVVGGAVVLEDVAPEVQGVAVRFVPVDIRALRRHGHGSVVGRHLQAGNVLLKLPVKGQFVVDDVPVGVVLAHVFHVFGGNGREMQGRALR